MYPYHNKIKQRIRNKELVRYEYLEKYKNITPCLLRFLRNTEEEQVFLVCLHLDCDLIDPCGAGWRCYYS